jgi:type I restriction enzyme S subunit
METATLKQQRYTKYKPSNEEWLGDIPEHWEISKFKRIFFEKKKTTNVDLNCGSISYGKVVYKNDESVPVATKKSYQVVSKGDFLVNPLNLNYDLVSLRIALSEIDVVVSSGYIVLNTNLPINKSYYKWLLHIFDIAFMKTLGSGVRQTLSYNHIANCELVIPPLEEQTIIAQFLEDKTTKIEQAIAIKQQQIELLKEHKQIVIHKAVTQGIISNDFDFSKVKFINSGIIWVGEIPDHWKIKKIKEILVEKKKTTNIELNCGSISYGKVVYKNDESVLESTKRSYQTLLKGEFIINPLNLNYDLKSLRIALSDKDVVVSSGYIVLNTKMEINKTYLNWQLHRFDIDFMKTLGSGVRQTLNYVEISKCELVVPPIEEQNVIVEYLEMATSKIDTAITLKVKEIDKLKEYKISLVNSVVTGKVRVT